MSKVIAQSRTSHPWASLFFYFGALFLLFIISTVVFGGSSGSGGQTLGDVSAQVTTSMTNVAKLISAISYVAGVGFALMGMLKLKAHKEQPTQVPLSQPMMLLAIAAGLIFLPSLVTSVGATIWGQDAANTTTTGTGVLGIDE